MMGHVMVVLDEKQWTLRALHLASAVSQSRGGEVALVAMVPVRHPALLGVDDGYVDFPKREREKLEELAQAVQAYNIPVTVYLCPYADYYHGLADIAEQLGADLIFARLLHGRLALWHRLRQWWLKRILAAHNQRLYCLENDGEVTKLNPAVILSSH